MKKILFLILLISFLPASKALAASVYFSSSTRIVVGDMFEMEIKADTGGESINSVDFILSYDTNLLSFVGYKENQTGVKLWIKSPYAEAGKIYMSGIIPGGISGLYDPKKTEPSDISIVRLLFKGEKPGSATLSFEQSRLLKNDGKGSYLPHTTVDMHVIMENTGGMKTIPDKNPPLPFNITFIDPFFFSKTPPMIIFEAKDMDSGIKSYEIKAGTGEWKVTESPAVVSKNILPYTVTVRAYDHYDNFRDARLKIRGYIPLPFSILILFLTIGIIAWYKSHIQHEKSVAL